jgi:hypothetical protein
MNVLLCSVLAFCPCIKQNSENIHFEISLIFIYHYHRRLVYVHPPPPNPRGSPLQTLYQNILIFKHEGDICNNDKTSFQTIFTYTSMKKYRIPSSLIKVKSRIWITCRYLFVKIYDPIWNEEEVNTHSIKCLTVQ